MKRKRGVPKALADDENAVILVSPEIEKPEPEPEDPAAVEWSAFAQDHYELVEQLPLSVHRSYSLMRELDELAQNNTALILPATRAYISLRDSLAPKPKHKRVPSGLDLLAHVSASVEPPTGATAGAGPVPNLAREGQETALEAVTGMLNGQTELVHLATPIPSPTTSAHPTTDSVLPLVEPSPPTPGSTHPQPDSIEVQPEPVQTNGMTGDHPQPVPGSSTSPNPPEAHPPQTHEFPQDSRKLLTLIATLASDAVRASSEKVGIANAVYHTVDNHLTAINALITQHKATLPRLPTPTPPPDPLPSQPSSPAHPSASPSLKIRTRRRNPQEQQPEGEGQEAEGEDENNEQFSTHETLPPLRLTRTGITAANTTPTTIRIRGKPKSKPADEPNGAGTTRPRSVSMSKHGPGSSSTKGGGSIKASTIPKNAAATPKHSSGGSNRSGAAPKNAAAPGAGLKNAPKSNKPPGKNNKKFGGAPGAEGLEDQMDVDPNEQKYCHCQRPSFGVMIACDGVDCPLEWFHLPCVGLAQAPAEAWFCSDCVENRRKRRRKC